MNILVTGCAGFIGFHLSEILCKDYNIKVIGIDNLNTYYSVKLKKDRLKILKKNKNFKFIKIDLAYKNQLKKVFKENKFNIIYNLAAQAGVRYSITNPEKYTRSNLIGFFNLLDLARINKVEHFISASTSSVYGDNRFFPLSEDQKTDKPISFYAATKKSNEVMGYSYSYIYNMKITFLRFFTVFGPMGRPDMSLFKFVSLIKNNKKIDLYNYGVHERDFTFIDDVVTILKKIKNKPSQDKIPYQLFNVCSNKPIKLKKFINLIENNLRKKAKVNYLDLQKGDIVKTHGNNTKLEKKIGKINFTDIKIGVSKYIKWYNQYFN